MVGTLNYSADPGSALRRKLAFWRASAIVVASILLMLAPVDWWFGYANGFQDGHARGVRSMLSADNALSRAGARERAMKAEIARLRASTRPSR